MLARQAAITVVGVVNSDTTDTSVTNCASVSSHTLDPDTGDQKASITTPIVRQADLTVVKTATSSPMTPGRPVNWLITITNHGPSTARFVQVVDALPSGLSSVVLLPSQGSCDTVGNCLLGDISNGSVATVVVTAVLKDDVAASTLTNDVVVQSTTPDPTQLSATVTRPVAPQADLHITKSGSPDPVVAGQNVTWTIDVRDDGPSDAAAVVIHDDLPSPLVLVNGGSCVSATVGINCNVGKIANGTTVSLTIVTSIPPDVLVANVANTASVSSATVDPDATDKRNVSIGGGDDRR